VRSVPSALSEPVTLRRLYRANPDLGERFTVDMGDNADVAAVLLWLEAHHVPDLDRREVSSSMVVPDQPRATAQATSSQWKLTRSSGRPVWGRPSSRIA